MLFDPHNQTTLQGLVLLFGMEKPETQQFNNFPQLIIIPHCQGRTIRIQI